MWGDGDQEDTDIAITRGHLGHRGQLASASREGSYRIEGAESGYGGSIASYRNPLLGKEDGAWEGRSCNNIHFYGVSGNQLGLVASHTQDLAYCTAHCQVQYPCPGAFGWRS